MASVPIDSLDWSMYDQCNVEQVGFDKHLDQRLLIGLPERRQGGAEPAVFDQLGLQLNHGSKESCSAR
jgi:hypothetical protein